MFFFLENLVLAPDEIFFNIFEYLDFYSLLSFYSSSTHYKTLAKNYFRILEIINLEKYKIPKLLTVNNVFNKVRKIVISGNYNQNKIGFNLDNLLEIRVEGAVV